MFSAVVILCILLSQDFMPVNAQTGAGVTLDLDPVSSLFDGTFGSTTGSGLTGGTAGSTTGLADSTSGSTAGNLAGLSVNNSGAGMDYRGTDAILRQFIEGLQGVSNVIDRLIIYANGTGSSYSNRVRVSSESLGNNLLNAGYDTTNTALNGYGGTNTRVTRGANDQNEENLGLGYGMSNIAGINDRSAFQNLNPNRYFPNFNVATGTVPGSDLITGTSSGSSTRFGNLGNPIGVRARSSNGIGLTNNDLLTTLSDAANNFGGSTQFGLSAPQMSTGIGGLQDLQQAGSLSAAGLGTAVNDDVL